MLAHCFAPQPSHRKKETKSEKKLKQKWSRGSLFKLPLQDGSYVIGLVLKIAQELYSFVGAFYNCKTNPDMDVSISDIDLHNPDIVQFVTRNPLDLGIWPVIKDGITNIKVEDFLDFAKFKSNGFINVTIFSAGIIANVFNILHHLKTNDFAKAGYIESLLYKNSKGRIDEYD